MSIDHYRFSTDERDEDQPLVSIRGLVPSTDEGEPDTVKVMRADGVETLRLPQDLQEPEFHLRGTIGCWLKVNAHGVVTGIEFNRDAFNASYRDGISFVKAAEAEGDGRDLSVQTVDAVMEVVEKQSGDWNIEKVADDYGTVYFDGTL